MGENLLGRNTPVVEQYSPELLYPIPRAAARDELGLGSGELPFCGEDTWHAWELSWLDASRRPHAAVGRFSVPFDTPMLVESKSFKLYLNSLNQAEFQDDAALLETLRRDLSDVARGPVEVELLDIDSEALCPASLPGTCLDGEAVALPEGGPDVEILEPAAGEGSGLYHSNLLRSLCPVTAQPDWASVVIELRGPQPTPRSLLAYLLAYRNHQEFHEQCVERIYLDLQRAFAPSWLSVQALYTRRGGLDINPWRCSEPLPAPRRRSPRQ